MGAALAMAAEGQALGREHPVGVVRWLAAQRVNPITPNMVHSKDLR